MKFFLNENQVCRVFPTIVEYQFYDLINSYSLCFWCDNAKYPKSPQHNKYKWFAAAATKNHPTQSLYVHTCAIYIYRYISLLRRCCVWRRRRSLALKYSFVCICDIHTYIHIYTYMGAYKWLEGRGLGGSELRVA